jgi:catechol 2,3-dioxygenase-like lactoylglutathione lyase family enzyme
MVASTKRKKQRTDQPAKMVVRRVSAEGFNHLHINVRDLPRSIRFYEAAFGLKVGFNAGPDLVFMVPQTDGHSLALHRAGNKEPVGMAGGFQHFGFKLDANNLDRAIAQVEDAGGKLVSRGKHDGTHPYAYVSDPDGYVIEI